MSYYVRLFTPSETVIPLSSLRPALREIDPMARVIVEVGDDEQWTELFVRVGADESGDVCTVERLPVGEHGGRTEIKESKYDISEARPESSRRWVEAYLDKCKTVYVIEMLVRDAATPAGAVFQALRNALWDQLGGIFQADPEGFTNDDGYHILWQFTYRAVGPRWMALPDGNGGWARFEMNLDDAQQRYAFLAGKVPDGVKRE